MNIRANVDRAALNERVTFQRSSVTQNEQGDPVSTWTSLGTVWARVDGTKAGERLASQAALTVGGYTVWVRADVVKRLALTAGDRAIWRGKVMDILDIPDQQLRGRLIALFVQTGASNG